MKFKDESLVERFNQTHPVLRYIARNVDDFCQEVYGKEIVVTAAMSTLEEDKSLGRVSATHRTGRAIDIRISNFEHGELLEIVTKYNTLFIRWAALNHSGVSQLMVLKKDHIHMQIKPIAEIEAEHFFREWG